MSAKKAAEALADLNTFAIIASILEGGHLYTTGQTPVQRILKICREEQQKLLTKYDVALVGGEEK